MLKRNRKINKVRLVSTSQAYGLRRLKAPLIVTTLLAAGIEPALVAEMVVQGRACTHFEDDADPACVLLWHETPHKGLWRQVDDHYHRGLV